LAGSPACQAGGRNERGSACPVSRSAAWVIVKQAGADAKSSRVADNSAPKSLTKREIKCLNAKIEELDFEGSVYDWTLLPDELIEPGLSNLAGAVRGTVNAAIFAGSGAVDGHPEANRLTVLGRS
jgi:hypothetical protein